MKTDGLRSLATRLKRKTDKNIPLLMPCANKKPFKSRENRLFLLSHK